MVQTVPVFTKGNWSVEMGYPSDVRTAVVQSATGLVNWNSTGTTTALSMQGYDPRKSRMTLVVYAKSGSSSDTFQLQTGNEAALANAFNLGDAYTLIASPTLPVALQWIPDGWGYFGVNITIGSGDSITYDTYYQLIP